MTRSWSYLDIINLELGASAGVPRLSRALVTDDNLWWAIGFEQAAAAAATAATAATATAATATATAAGWVV